MLSETGTAAAPAPTLAADGYTAEPVRNEDGSGYTLPWYLTDHRIASMVEAATEHLDPPTMTSCAPPWRP